MKNIIKAAIITLALLPSAAAVSQAQELKSSYFMEGAAYRHKMNPAFFNESSYINLPFIALGNFSLGLNSNMGLSNFIYPTADGGLTTFMNSSVSTEEFIGGLSAENRLTLDLSTDILSLGFFGIAGGFNTIELGLRSNTSVNLPKELFAVLKNFMPEAEGTSYHIRNIGVTSNNFLQFSLGHSRYVWKDRISVGAKLKFLVGVASLDANIDRLDLYFSKNVWNADISGSGYLALKGAGLTSDADNYIDGFDFNSNEIGIGGYGAAIDLGAYFDMDYLVPGLAISASVTDLGFINWSGVQTADWNGNFEFTGMDNIGQGNSLDSELDALGQRALKFIRPKKGEELPSKISMLSAKMYISAEYKLPMYDKVKFGLLSATTFNGPHTYSEARLVAQYSPAKWFEFSLNYAYGSLGHSFGWMLNFHPKGFNFFIGNDNFYLGKYSPQLIPVGKIKMNINFGFNITWGSDKIASHMEKLKD